jgi:hypothetical protein
MVYVMPVPFPLDRHQHVTINGDGRRAVVIDVHTRPGDDHPYAYTIEEGWGPAKLAPASQVTPALLDLGYVDAKMAEASASGLVDGSDARFNQAALAFARAAESLRAEVGYLRRRLELAEGYTRLGARDGAVRAAADALLEEMRRRGELDDEVDPETEDSLRELAEAAVNGALPVLAPYAHALQELRDLLPGPCPVPDMFDGVDQCEHGTWDHCPVTRAAWIAAGLDPAEEKRRVVAEYKRRHRPVDVAGEGPGGGW